MSECYQPYKDVATWVDKIPWETCAIALIIRVLKAEFEKALLSFQLKIRFCPLSSTHYNVESVTKLRLHVSNIVDGVGGRGEEV